MSAPDNLERQAIIKRVAAQYGVERSKVRFVHEVQVFRDWRWERVGNAERLLEEIGGDEPRDELPAE